MAWDEFERGGRRVFSGDDPLDEFDIALRKIAAAYQRRFNRRPLVDELLISLERLLASRPDQFVADPEGLQSVTITAHREAREERLMVDTSRYEGAYTDIDPPRHLIQLRDAPGESELISIPYLELDGRTLDVRYRINSDTLDDAAVIALVPEVLLGEFSNDYYRGKADTIRFRNLGTGAQQQIPYPRSR